jgi:hypothetical protein
MTVLEALVALMIALGVVTAAVEASRMAISRSTIARLQVEATLDTETLLARVGNDIPLSEEHLEGDGGNGEHWIIDIVPTSAPTDVVRAYEVHAEVRLLRAGISAQSRLATLKLQWGKR